MNYKTILILIFSIVILSSCSKKLHPDYMSINDIDASVINLQTSNKKFIPNERYSPLFVRVNFIFPLDDNGGGNFNGKNTEDVAIWNDIFKKSNNTYANLVNPNDPACYKGNDFISDSKIQFLFNTFYFKDSFARNYLNAKGYSEKKRNLNLLTPSKNWYLSYLDKNISDTISKKGINVYNTVNASVYNDLVNNNSETSYINSMRNAISQFPSYTDFTRSSQINYPNKYTSRLWMENIYAIKNKKSWQKSVKGFFISNYRGLSHELGHSLGIAHSNEYHGTNKCFKGLMSQSGKSPRNYIQPSEIGKIHKALMTSNLIQFVTEDSNFNVPLVISANENWVFNSIRFYQDIIVNDGTILILNGSVILPPNASITLKKNAILVLNHATLKTATNKPFTNFILMKHAKIIRY